MDLRLRPQMFRRLRTRCISPESGRRLSFNRAASSYGEPFREFQSCRRNFGGGLGVFARVHVDGIVRASQRAPAARMSHVAARHRNIPSATWRRIAGIPSILPWSWRRRDKRVYSLTRRNRSTGLSWSESTSITSDVAFTTVEPFSRERSLLQNWRLLRRVTYCMIDTGREPVTECQSGSYRAGRGDKGARGSCQEWIVSTREKWGIDLIRNG